MLSPGTRSQKGTGSETTENVVLTIIELQSTLHKYLCMKELGGGGREKGDLQENMGRLFVRNFVGVAFPGGDRGGGYGCCG